MTLTHVIQFVASTHWMLEPGFHARMMSVLGRRLSGEKLSAPEIDAAIGGRSKRSVDMTVSRGVATIPIHGVIAPRASAVGAVSSSAGTSVEHIRADFQEALRRDDVAAIVFDVDSPGGSVGGIDDLATEIREARGKKPMVAQTDGLMASAAYYLASQADQVMATRSATVGSIGVISSFMDSHRFLQDQGFDPVVVKSVPGKGGVQSNGTLSDQDRADIQADVDAHHALFVEAVAAGRGIDPEAASKMADGRVRIGVKAEAEGFVDRVGTLAGARRLARTMARDRAAAAGEDLSQLIGDGAGSDNQTEEVTQMVKKTTDPDPAPQTEPNAKASTEPAPAPTPEPTPTPAAPAPDATEQERSRVQGIMNASIREQHDLAMGLINDGTPLDAALQQINADLKERMEASAPTPDPEPVGQANASDVMPAGVQEDSDEEWDNPEVQAEFGNDREAYDAYKRAEANGQIRFSNSVAEAKK